MCLLDIIYMVASETHILHVFFHHNLELDIIFTILQTKKET